MKKISPLTQFSVRAILSRVYVQLDARPIKGVYRLLLLLLFFRLKSTCSLRLWCFTHHATSSFETSIMIGFVYLLLAYLHATSLLIFYFFSHIAV